MDKGEKTMNNEQGAMKNGRQFQNMKQLVVVTLAVTIATIIFPACSSRQALEDAPIITSATHQHTLYNGRGQPIEANVSKEGAPSPIITYFRSEEELIYDRNGSTEVPVEPGNYYVRIRRPAGKGYRAGNDITVEYHIQKALININAEAKQEFAYDGRPKAVVFSVDQNVKLDIEYFRATNGEFLKGPPAERGVYRALISYTTDAHYIGASKEIDLIIR
jgi:hypothetical protein